MYSTGPEHRDAGELQNIVNQLKGLPIYLGHPTVFPAKDSGQKIVGYVESGRVDEDTAVGKLVITDDEALAAIESGTYELSLGYACGLDGDRYQRNIQLDHLAIVDRARCGPSCSMRTDMLEPLPKEETVKVGELEVPLNITLNLNGQSADAEEVRKLFDAMSAMGKENCSTCGEIYAKGESHTCAKADEVQPPVKSCTCNNRATGHNNGETMSDTNEDKAKLDAALAEVTALKAKVTELEVEATNARKDADAAKAKLEAAQADADKAKADAEAAVAQAKADAQTAIDNELNARVAARVDVMTEAARFELKDAEGNKLDLSKLSNREIKVAVIKHVDGDEVPAEKSDDFVDGVYRGSLKRGQDAAGSRADARVAINQMRADAAAAAGAKPTGRAAEEAAKEAMKRESALAWTKTNTENA